MFSFHDYIIYICLHRLANLFFQAYLNHALVSGAGVFESERHSVEAERSIRSNECRCGLIGFLHLNFWYPEYASRKHSESCPAVASMIWSMRGSGKGSLGQALLRSLKSTQRCQDLSLFGTMAKLANQSGCLISLINPASSNLASSSPMA